MAATGAWYRLRNPSAVEAQTMLSMGLMLASYQANVAQAQANLAAVQAQIEQVAGQRPLLDANLQAAEAVAVATTASFAQATRDIARQSKLLNSGSSSRQQLEQIQTSHTQSSRPARR